VADAPEATESLVKKEPEVPVNDPIVSRSTSGIMLICALLLTISLAWALYDEALGQRPWKGIQKEFVSRYSRYLRSIKPQAGKTEAELKESPEYQALDAEAQAALDEVKPETAEIDRKVAHVQQQLNAVTDPFQNQRGRLTVISYNIETATGSAKEKYRKEAERKRAEVVEVELPASDGSGTVAVQKVNYQQLEKLYNDLRDEKAQLLGRKAELLKQPTEVAKKRDDYLKHHLIGLGPAQIDGLLRKMDAFDYSILGHQISVNSANIVDRCEVCHVGIREPLNIRAEDLAPDGPGKKPDSLARAFVSHPDKELLRVHNPDRFGCSGCHWGNGRATTSDVKGHGRHKYWLWPLFEKENIEAGCQQCHARDRVTQGAETLNLGRDLFAERGCVGCHRYEGFDRETDALSAARQNTTQLEEQVLANEKQIREDTEAANQAADDAEAQRLLAHAEALRVTNSLLAARKDQVNLQSKYLMQDQKKVGPNLKDVKLKLRKEWIPVWLKDPQAFRPGTKMPQFWRFGIDQDGEDQIKAISAYLWQESFDGRIADQPRGDATHGKELFETRGCLACHSIGEGDSVVGGHFAANLQRVGEKANYEYIVRWIHNPRERWAPYCPKEKRDLTPADYSQHNLPYAFDTELHSRCPNDGTELQVQNMTVMPNFRMPDIETRDIATYLFSLSSAPSYPDAAYMDDPNLKARGQALIKQYGCAGCHEIKGFEEEQRIGKELTVEGATPIERLDFALLTHDAEKGHEVLPLDEHAEANAEQGAKHEAKPWYNHKGFFEHKLADPSIYDRGKEKDPKDRLRMPKPYLTPEWRNALTTMLLGSVGTEGSNVPRSLFFEPEDQRRQDVQNGWWVIKKYNCVGCHQIQVGQRSVLMGVPFYQTPEGKDLLPPRLTSEGARVDPSWLLRFLHDPSLSEAKGTTAFAQPQEAATPAAAASPAVTPTGPNPSASPSARPAATAGSLKAQPGLNRNGVRPYLKARMPTFNFSPNELQTLVRFFMALSGQQEPYIKEPLQPLTEEEKLVARQMFTSGTPCLKCHITGDPVHDEKAIAPNFLLAGERLKPEWTFRWLLDPAQISPGTAMPSGLFRREGERWVINLPNPPASANAYHQDHALLLVRYMLLLTPEEQRRLLATSPVQPAATAASQVQGALRHKHNNSLANSRRKYRRGVVARSAPARNSFRSPGF
jgi:cytochrome c2